MQCQLIICFVARPSLVASGDTLTDPKTNETRNILAEIESHQASKLHQKYLADSEKARCISMARQALQGKDHREHVAIGQSAALINSAREFSDLC